MSTILATRRVTAGPYTLELPANGVAILHEADGAGVDHQLPGGVGYLEALVQFAGEVIRLQSMVSQMQTDRSEQDLALRDAIRETAATADELAFWKYQAIWQRAVRLQHDLMTTPAEAIEDTPQWKEAERQLEAARADENRERIEGRS
jgi:hypothetical protein